MHGIYSNCYFFLLNYYNKWDNSKFYACESSKPMTHKVLFLGVTNHCASRFAEIMFNHLAGEQLLNFYGASRGVMVGHQQSPIDPRTVTALTVRGIPMTANPRAPVTLKQRDLMESDYLVLVSGTELSKRISRARNLQEKQVIEWNFANVNKLTPSQLFPALEAEVYLLIRRLQQHHQKTNRYQDHISA